MTSSLFVAWSPAPSPSSSSGAWYPRAVPGVNVARGQLPVMYVRPLAASCAFVVCVIEPPPPPPVTERACLLRTVFIHGLTQMLKPTAAAPARGVNRVRQPGRGVVGKVIAGQRRLKEGDPDFVDIQHIPAARAKLLEVAYVLTNFASHCAMPCRAVAPQLFSSTGRCVVECAQFPSLPRPVANISAKLDRDPHPPPPQPIFTQLSHPFPLPNPILHLGIPWALVKLME